MSKIKEAIMSGEYFHKKDRQDFKPKAKAINKAKRETVFDKIAKARGIKHISHNPSHEKWERGENY